MIAGKKNMYTSGEFLAKNPSWGSEDSEWKATEIDGLIKRNNLTPASVAEVGCGFGQILLHLSQLNTSIRNFTGFDISPQAIDIARKSETEKIKFYLVDFIEEITARFDLLLVIDVIEHVENYADFLSKIKSRADQFIFHIPLDLSCRTLLKPHIILQQRNDVGHLHYFSKEHVEWTLNDAGFKIVDWVYTFPEIDREKSKNLKAWIKKVLRRISFSLHKNFSAKLWGGYSIMILAAKNE